MLVVYLTALVLFVQTGLGALVGFAVETDDPLRPEGRVRKDKDMKGILPVLQDVIRVPSHDDTGAFLRQLENDAALDVPQEVGGGQAVHDAGNTLGGEGVREQTAAGRMLAVFLNEFGGKSRFHRDLINQLLVIEGNAELIRKHTANGTAAGTELTADGDDFLFHCIASFRECLCFSYLYYSKVATKCQ